jgi:DNA-binding NarL/FixJ family response regulator
MAIPKVIIVEDHDIFRDGLVSLLTMKGIAEVIGVASNGEEFLEILENNTPDIVLMDISMPVMNGHIATVEAIKKYPDLKILVLSMFGDEKYYYQMIDAGVKGFILKSSGKEELINAIKLVAQGNSYFSNELLRNIIINFGKKEVTETKTEKLTNREFEILNLMCAGMSANEIANELNLSKKTVEGHRTNLFIKTQTKNSVALVIYAIKNRLVEI